MFQKLDRDGTITNLLQQEKENPEMMLPEEEQQLVRRARKELRCPICIAMLYGAEERARNTPGGRSLRSEADLSTIMDTICDGPAGSIRKPTGHDVGYNTSEFAAAVDRLL